MKSSRWCPIIVLATAFFLPHILKSEDAVVVLRKADGSEKNLSSAQAALDEAKSGDTVILKPGIHQGTLSFKDSNVKLKGEPGATVSAYSRDWKPEWKKEPTYGPYAYTSPIPFQPSTVAIDNRVMIDIRQSRAGKNLAMIHKYGIGRNGREPLQGLFTYLPKEKLLLVSFASDIDPAKQKIEVAPDNASAVLISGFDNCSVEGLIITGGSNGVKFEKTKNSSVSKCLIMGSDICALLSKGAESCKVLSNDITWNADALCMYYGPVLSWDTWESHKKYGTYDKWGILAECSGDNNEAAYNYLYNGWDGIENGDGNSKDGMEEYYTNIQNDTVQKYNKGLKIHHNRIDLMLDDALEPGNCLIDNQWYSNIVSRARCATRIKTVSVGPFYFFDNALTDCGDGMRFYKSTPENALVYVYHNLIQFREGICYHRVDLVAWNNKWLEKNLKRGTPGFNVFNNIFLCEVPFSNDSPVKPNFTANFNMYTCPQDQELAALGIDKESIFDAKPGFLDAEKADFRLKDGSQGKDAGMDLSQYKTKLPFCDKKYFSGKLPDIGRIGIDSDKTPHGPISGLWQVASKSIDLEPKKYPGMKLEPVRWIYSKRADFVIKNMSGNESTLNLFYAMEKAGGSYSITAMNEKGESLGKNSGIADTTFGPVPFKLNPNGAKQIKLLVEDKPDSVRWRFSPALKDARIGFDAKDWTFIMKFDDVPYILECDIPQDTESFRVILDKDNIVGSFRKPQAEVLNPKGERIQPDSEGKIATGGVAGTYKILFSFYKKMKFKIEAPEPILYFPKLGEEGNAISIWKKPSY